MNKTTSLPFGLRFEEHPNVKDFIIPLYDEDEDISVVIDENGRKIPSVEYYGNLGTRTATKVQNEGTDEDPGSSNMGGTRTLTEVKDESSDSDEDRFSLILGTRTETFVQSEQSDEDPGIDVEPRPPLTTRTATSVAREDTDKD
jgi:hypothetical protein